MNGGTTPAPMEPAARASVDAMALSKSYADADSERFAPAKSIFDKRRRRRGAMVSGAGDTGDFDDEELDDEPDFAIEEPVTGVPEIPLPDAPGEVVALEDVTFAVEGPCCLGIVGGSAAGKTTLIRILGGVTPPSGGRAVVHGRVAPTAEFAAMLMRPDREPADNARVVAGIVGISRRRRAEVADAAVTLAFPDSRELDSLPQKHVIQRLATAMALDPTADVLLLDEPPFAADSGFRERCIARIFDARERGAVVIIATQDTELVSQVCDHVLWLEAGKVAAFGHAPDVLAEYGSRFAPATGHSLPPARHAEAALRGFDASAAILEVSANIGGNSHGTWPPSAVASDLLVRIRLEISRPSVRIRCIVRLIREDGWRRRYAQEDPVPQFDPGIYDVTIRLPEDSVAPGRYEVEARAKLNVNGKKTLIGRSRAAVLDVVDPGETPFERAEEETVTEVGLADEIDTEEPLFVGWSISRVAD